MLDGLQHSCYAMLYETEVFSTPALNGDLYDDWTNVSCIGFIMKSRAKSKFLTSRSNSTLDLSINVCIFALIRLKCHMINKENINSLMLMQGRVRGAVFETDAEYVKRRYGIQGLERVKAALHELGYDVQYGRISAMEWLPLGLRASSLMVIKDLFSMSDLDIKDMGDAAPKYSFIVKLLMKFFISPKVAFEHAPEYWEKHYDTGQLEARELNEEKGYAIIHLHDFTVHPIYCKYLEGYFGRLFKFMYPNSHIEIKEDKCMCRNDSYHEFFVTMGGMIEQG